MKRNRLLAAALSLAFSSVLATSTMAQPQPGGPGGGQGFQQRDPAQMQQMIRQSMTDAIKEALGASDQEWAILWPKIEAVQNLQNATGSGLAGSMQSLQRMMGRMAGGGRGGQQNLSAMMGIKDSAMSIKLQELQKALDNLDTPDSAIKMKLDEVRQARDRSKAELAKARKDLTDLLTSRQEAALFQMGILE